MENENKSALIYDQPEISMESIVEHLVHIGAFLYCIGRFYLYDRVKSIFVPLSDGEIWFHICQYLSERVIELFQPKDIKRLIEEMKYNRNIHFEINQFNSSEDLININNGVLNVNTGELTPKKREYYFTFNIDASFLDNATIDNCPAFKGFCETSLCGDEKSITLLLQIIGYICCSYSFVKKAFMLIGKNDSGKSKILELIVMLVGEHCVSNISLHKLGNRFNIAELSRHKVNIHAELSQEPLRDIETFKNAVGGDRLCGEYKGKDPFYFKNSCKFLFAGNGMPPLKSQDTTRSFVSRLIFLVFPKEIPENERDPDLLDKLYAERDVIFSLAMKELQRLIKNGFKFELPELSKIMLQSFAEENNQIEDFLNEHCVFGAEHKIFSCELYKAYEKFCHDNCLFAHNQKAFLDAVAMREGVIRNRITINGKRLRGFEGIGLNMQDSDVSHSDSLI